MSRASTSGPGNGQGRKPGSVAPLMKPWMRSTFARIVTETDLIRWFNTLTGKEKLEFLRSLDPYDGEKKVDDVDPDSVAAKIREMVQAIDVTVNATREVIVVRGDEIDVTPQGGAK